MLLNPPKKTGTITTKPGFPCPSNNGQSKMKFEFKFTKFRSPRLKTFSNSVCIGLIIWRSVIGRNYNIDLDRIRIITYTSWRFPIQISKRREACASKKILKINEFLKCKSLYKYMFQIMYVNKAILLYKSMDVSSNF